MSSTECDLQNEMPQRPGECTFTWSIKNYSYCTKGKKAFFCSPDFRVDFLGVVVWWLSIYPRGDEATDGYFSCYLRGGDVLATCSFTLSIRKSNGQFKEGSEKAYGYPSKGYSKFVSLGELQSPDGYLVDDTLTVRCRMWRTGVDVPASVKWEAHSKIKVSKLDYTWILNGISVSNKVFEKKFNESINITEFFYKTATINLKVFKKESCECAINFGVEMIKPKDNYFWIVVVHLIDSSESVAYSASSEHLFESSNETLVWNFPLISKEKLYHNRKLFLPNNNLTLRCELSFSNNILETFAYKTTNELGLESTTIDQHSDLQRVWFKNMKQCYKDGKFSDFIIRTPDNQFPVHKAILGSHSEVFEAMFERDMEERKTGVVDVDDLADETVYKMLTYVYTSTLDDIDCPSAQKLYYAADKYGIAALKKKCSIYLKGCLDVSNVCDILELADRHGDQELKSFATDFFHAHAKEIMSSEGWRKLRETNLPLTAETMEWILCNKFLI